MASKDPDHDSDEEYNARYQKFQDNKTKMINNGLKTIDRMKVDVHETGNMIDEDNRILENINRKGDDVLRTA